MGEIGSDSNIDTKSCDCSVILLPLPPASLMHKNLNNVWCVLQGRTNERAMVDQMSHLCNLESLTTYLKRKY